MGAHAEAAAAAGQRLGDEVHAVQAQHLLVQVDLTRQIGTERGGNHVQHILVRGVFDLATQALQNLDDELARDLGTHHGTEARDAELQLRGGAGLGPHVDDALVVGRGGAYGAAGNLHDEGRRGGGTRLDAVVVHTALIAHGAFADKPKVAAGAAGAARLERGGFQQDVHRIIGHLGVKAAHDAGQGNRALLRGGDDGHVAGKGALLAVKRGQRLAVLRGAHHDVRTAIGILQFVQVERVQRLAEQEQDVVRDVDDVVDGTLADGRKALDHPVGAGTHLAAADDARRVARAALSVLDRDLDLFVNGGCGGVELELGRHLRQRVVPVATVHRAHLASQACDGEAVGAVRGDLQVEHGVGETGVLGERDAHRGIFGQDHDAVVVAAQAELARGAVHAEACNAAQLGLLDLHVAGQLRADHCGDDMVALVEVLGAADDLQRLGVAFFVDVEPAHVDRAHPHVIGVGMMLLFEHLGGYHMVERGAKRLNALHARSRKVEFVAERLDVRRDLNVFVQPFQRYFHDILFL